MFLTAGVIAALLLSLVILFFAITMHRRQQLLNEKRAEYMTVKRNNFNHWKKFEAGQVEMDHLRADLKSRIRDMNVMFLDMDHKRKEVREVLEILREENEQAIGRMDRELSKIVERRKNILRSHWKELNGLKTLFIHKMQEIVHLRGGVDNILSRKDSEYQKWTHTKIRMEQLKHEFEMISRTSVLSFVRKRD